MIINKIVSLLVLIGLFFGASVSVAAQSVLQSYKSDEPLQKGMLVTADPNDASKVKAITNQSAEGLRGVVADPSDSNVTFRSDDQKVYVATTGPYEVLVTNESGSIQKGDYVTISSLAGVGGKASESHLVVLGQAATGFNGEGDAVGKTALSNGKTVALGRIMVDVAISRNPLYKAPLSEQVPNKIETTANGVAGKSVSSPRVYLGLVILLIAVIVSATVLYSGVKHTMISIGRNPLSRGIIFRGLFQVMILSAAIFITGLFAVYLLLKL